MAQHCGRLSSGGEHHLNQTGHSFRRTESGSVQKARTVMHQQKCYHYVLNNTLRLCLSLNMKKEINLRS